jgi:hypothetical protein
VMKYPQSRPALPALLGLSGAKTCHGLLLCACESDAALPQSWQRDVPRSYSFYRSVRYDPITDRPVTF